MRAALTPHTELGRPCVLPCGSELNPLSMRPERSVKRSADTPRAGVQRSAQNRRDQRVSALV